MVEELRKKDRLLIQTKALSEIEIPRSGYFAIIGDGPKAGDFNYNKEKTTILCVNRSYLKQDEFSHIVTIHYHRNFMINNLNVNRPGIDTTLTTITDKDIRKYTLIGGDTLNVLFTYIVKQTNDAIIYLTGVDMTPVITWTGRKRKWDHVVKRLHFDYNCATAHNTRVFQTGNNEKIGFIPVSHPPCHILR